MKKFLYKTAIIFILIFITAIILYFFPGHFEDYYAENIDKQKMIQTIEPPRLIFVGGSNLAFGLDSEMIEKETGYKTINMGLHATLGLRFIAEEIKPFIQKGDIYVVVPEYDLLFSSSTDGFGKELMGFLDTNPGAIKYMSPFQLCKVMGNLPVLFRCKVKALLYNSGMLKYEERVYSRRAFNIFGDAVGHVNEKPWEIRKNPHLSQKIGSQPINVLNKFAEYAESKGAKVYFCYSPYLLDSYKDNEQCIQKLKEELPKMTKMQILGPPETYIFPSEYFFDTSYHLNGKGRELRTKRLIEELKKVLP